MKSDWDPEAYLKFKNERTQPALDLISRIAPITQPAHIMDIGCGPGNSCQALLLRWPKAKITGIDASEKMVQTARAQYPEHTWIWKDITKHETAVKYDIVFSNATIQWISNHDALFEKMHGLLQEKGVLAIQVPRFNTMPLSSAIEKVSQNEPWKQKMQNCSSLFAYFDEQYYYNLMSKKYKTIEIWQTEYVHIMDSHQAIIEWIRSTGMKPHLDCIDETQKTEFEKMVLEEIKNHYPLQRDGKVLFPFKRLFLLGYK